jgi:cytochrome c-type biogenesis protein
MRVERWGNRDDGCFGVPAYRNRSGHLSGFSWLLLRLPQIVYDIVVPNAFTRFDLLTVAVIAGLAAFFSPCAFPIIPSYMSYYLSAEEAGKRHGVKRAIYLGRLASLGLTLVNVGVGIVIGLLGQASFQPDPRLDPLPLLGVRVAAGLAIAILGVMKLADYSFNIPLISSAIGSVLKSSKNAGIAKSLFLYGMTYNLVGVGCTGPILLSLVLYAFVVGSYLATVVAFLVFSFIMGLLMVFVTVLAALSKSALIGRLRSITPTTSKVGGAVMFAAGVFTMTFTGNEFFVRLFFPFLPPRNPTLQEILWVTLVPISSTALAAYAVLRKRRKHEAEEELSAQNAKRLLLKIKGMHCRSCAPVIEHALKRQKGVLTSFT